MIKDFEKISDKINIRLNRLEKSLTKNMDRLRLMEKLTLNQLQKARDLLEGSDKNQWIQSVLRTVDILVEVEQAVERIQDITSLEDTLTESVSLETLLNSNQMLI